MAHWTLSSKPSVCWIKSPCRLWSYAAEHLYFGLLAFHHITTWYAIKEESSQKKKIDSCHVLLVYWPMLPKSITFSIGREKERPLAQCQPADSIRAPQKGRAIAYNQQCGQTINTKTEGYQQFPSKLPF